MELSNMKICSAIPTNGVGETWIKILLSFFFFSIWSQILEIWKGWGSSRFSFRAHTRLHSKNYLPVRVQRRYLSQYFILDFLLRASPSPSPLRLSFSHPNHHPFTIPSPEPPLPQPPEVKLIRLLVFGPQTDLYPTVAVGSPGPYPEDVGQGGSGNM